MNNNLVLDITRPDQQLVSYNDQLIGFYDGFKANEPTLYIYIKSAADKYTIVRRKANKRKVANKMGDMIEVEEKELYSRAYNKYLELKESNSLLVDPEKAMLQNKLAALEEKLNTQSASEQKEEDVADMIEEEPAKKANSKKSKKKSKVPELELDIEEQKSFDEIQEEKDSE